jgi:hypothetical protein
MLLATLVTSSGCVSALATALWVLKGTNIPAEYDGLRAKRVVVVCRPVTASLYSHPGVAKDVSRQISRLLQEHVPKIEVVDQRKVAEWIDNHTWDNYLDIGEALEAEMVVGIDLEHFSIYQGQTLYQGKADCTIEIYDCQTGERVFEKRPPQAVYPPNHVISTSDMQEAEFRRRFVRILCEQIARHFYGHDPHVDFAMDATAIQ